jgi:hypothetical protein
MGADEIPNLVPSGFDSYISCQERADSKVSTYFQRRSCTMGLCRNTPPVAPGP